MKKSTIKKYARLIVRIGANVQKGQTVVISCAVDQENFCAMVMDECYKAGAKKVFVNWHSDKITRLNYRNESVRVLSKVLKWQEEKIKWTSEQLPAMIHIISEDPDGLKGVSPAKMQKVKIANYKITKPYIEAMESRYQWTIAAVPSAAWAKKVFPNFRKSQAIEKLWQAILESVYVTDDNDPIEAWNKVNADFKSRCEKLNKDRFEYLTYKSANGTDFKVWLMPQSLWCGGGENDLNGHFYNPNMPTIEVFTTPMKGKAEGKLVSTKPLSYQGQLIENFSFEFKDGKAVSCEAEKGKELLEKMITSDEGACMIGEVALVPCDSPISNQNILYYETLFDENASCHIALGRGYRECVEGYADMTADELKELGVNDSMIHVDFMVGAEDMSIIGHTFDGRDVEVFRDGNFVI